MRIVICLNTAWNLINFRAGLIRALVSAGHEVVAVAPDDRYAGGLQALGCRFVPFHMENGGTNPFKDVLLLWRFVRLLARERPDVYLGYTVKPNVYGSLAAHMLGIPVVNNIAGLGAVFISGGWVVWVVRSLYRTALKRSAKVFFQNRDDQQLFINGGLVRPGVTDLLPGSGIDLIHFAPISKSPLNRGDSKFRFVLIARMLRDKGVMEYVEAAKVVRNKYPQAECCLLGPLDVQNPAAISRAEMDAWVASGAVNYLGVTDDVRIEIADADCVVLPSYREGTPRTLLEAGAMARPIITTDVVGCREVVNDGVNGYLCNVRDAADLAQRMEQMLSLSPGQRAAMGLRGRRKIESEFDERIVIEKYLATIKML